MDFFSKQRIFGGLLVLLVLCNVVFLGLVWKAFFEKERRPDPAYDAQQFMQRELKLTDEQMAQLEALRAPHLAATKEILDDIHAMKERLTTELFAAAPDTAMMDEVTQAIGRRYTELEQMHYQYFLSLRELFDAEQQAEFHELLRDLLRQVQPPPLPQNAQPAADSAPGREPGRAAGPPQAAIDACQGKQAGDACRFTEPHGTLTGTCQQKTRLVCVP